MAVVDLFRVFWWAQSQKRALRGSTTQPRSWEPHHQTPPPKLCPTQHTGPIPIKKIPFVYNLRTFVGNFWKFVYNFWTFVNNLQTFVYNFWKFVYNFWTFVSPKLCPAQHTGPNPKTIPFRPNFKFAIWLKIEKNLTFVKRSKTEIFYFVGPSVHSAVLFVVI